MFTRLALSLALTGLAIAPALALNPQPLPPFALRAHEIVKLADGTNATVSDDGRRLSVLKNGKMVLLPPGPCKLADGHVITIGTEGRIGSQTGGAGAGKMVDRP